MKINNRKGISALGLDLTSFPLVCMFFASLLTLGQLTTSFQSSNPYGISNTFPTSVNPFSNPYTNSTTNPNLNNVTASGGVIVNPIQQSSNNQCSINKVLFFTFIPITSLVAGTLFLGCVVTTNITTVVQSLILKATASSSTPQSVTLGFITIILFLMGAVLITGISVLSTGLNTASIYIIFSMGGYVLIWILLSSLSFPVFNGNVNAIPQPFGNLFFFLLTGMYTFGIFKRVF